MRKSIYGVILENTNNGIVDEMTVCSIITPSKEGEITFSAGFLDTFIGDDDVREEHTEKVLKVIEKVYNGELNSDLTESELIRIDFKTINIMDDLIEKINEENYNIEVYNIFKELLYNTKDIEICKFALEMTAIAGLCEELIDEYMLFGQIENFANPVSFIMRVWQKKEKFNDAIFKLLDYSERWSAINYSTSLMQIESIMEEIENHKKILIGALNKNPLTMEMCTELAIGLDIKGLLAYDKMDKELAYHISELFRSLLHESQPCGGIFAVWDYKDYLIEYITFLKDSKYEDVKFVGFRNLKIFLDGNQEEWIESEKESLEEKELGYLVKEIEEEWEALNTIENFEEIIALGNEYLFDFITYSLKNDVSREVLTYFEEMYKNEKIEDFSRNYLEKLLVKKGSAKIKKKLYFALSDLYKERIAENNKYSKKNIFTLDKQIGKIRNKVNVIPDMLELASIELLKKVIKDYNPEVRVLGLMCVKTIYMNDKEELDEEIISLVKEKINDEPIYVANTAKEVWNRINNED
ncbi:hypothetical protein [uncultured Clostridium sp.]|jgi:hypothetical protein|uniref:hypothetical protein n=1 Tax=uncultured Clostridium sp. TaxID=59620 RepID=UPI00263A1827|nr:hypothetical protein [uncultured Clostridium sp.]